MHYISLPIAGNVILNLLGGAASSYNVKTTVPKVLLAPPKFIFPIVWTFLYILLGIVAGNIRTDLGLFLYYAQLGLNFIWCPLYFTQEWKLLSLIIIFLMIAASVLLCYYERELYPYLLPYIGWLVYASYLNI